GGPVESDVVHSVSSATVGMDEKTELECLRGHAKDLTEKLERFRMMRKADREKLVEYERMKVQLHLVNQNRAHLSDERLRLEGKLREKEQEVKRLREWKESRINSNEDMEILALAKDMAEEKAEQLQEQVDELKTRME
ncbi:hypothetical protein PENTCL1PPCAC_10529, partial [Pristionchus entomophagus]